jgi:hypothetical protein
MIDFLLDNNIALILGVVIALNAWEVYARHVAVRDIPDDWLEAATYAILAKKYGRRHREFINTPIKLSRDQSTIYPTEDGYVRRFKE